MLKLTPASQARPKGKRPIIGLAVAGGGPLGAIYELGALQAIDEAIDGVHMHNLDVYVGVSSGSFLTASLANRVTATQMGRIFMGAPDAEFSFQPELFLRPALREYLDRAMALPSVIVDVIREAINNPSGLGVERLDSIARLIPTGLFDNQMIEQFLSRVLTRQGRSNDFRDLSAKLRIVAVELDSGHVVRFGEPGLDDVPISTAVQASAALPGLYPPVEINQSFYVDGALRRTLHASVALNEGADLLIGINPLVPYDGDHASSSQSGKSRMMRGGLPMVLSQTFRALIQSRMQVGMAKYEKEYPAVGMMLVEPNRNDEQMFFTNIFSYSSRNELVDHAYRSTRAELLARADELEPFLETYDLGLNRTRLEKTCSFHETMDKQAPYLAPLGNDLARTLDSLERLIR